MITKFIPYPIDFIPQIEKYLEQQALIGNRLIEINFWTFVFEEATPQKREYFIYSPAFADKTDKFYSSYLFAKKKYQKKNSKLNKTLQSCFEIDQDKKDTQFNFYRKSRTMYYLKYRIVFAIVYFLLLVVFSALSFGNPVMIVPSILFSLVFSYHIFSIIWLKATLKQQIQQ